MSARRRRSAADLLSEALTHLQLAQQHGTGDLTSQLVIDAVSLRLAAAIDALSALPEEVLDEHFGSIWVSLKGMRNRIVHGYLLVDPRIVSRTVERDVPDLIARVAAALAGQQGTSR